MVGLPMQPKRSFILGEVRGGSRASPLLSSRERMTTMTKTYCWDSSTFENVVVGFGSCIASDRITVDGALVGLMYREVPQNDLNSGWRYGHGLRNKPSDLFVRGS